MKIKYIVQFIDFIASLQKSEIKFDDFVPYIQELFISNLKTIQARKYADLLIQFDKSKYLEYCCKTDPLPSNIDYYKSL